MNDIPQIKLNGVITDLCTSCFNNSREKGFWSEPRNKGEMIALMHSELSECLEAIRKPQQDNHIPGFSMEVAELADTMIRIFDYCGGHGLPLEEALVAKMAYNKTRPYKHGKQF